jgi:two-component system NarL family response regulator
VQAVKIILADDHPLFREGLQNLLESRGYEVVATVGDGKEALAKALECRPDILLMDIFMPKCNGLEAARLIKTALPKCKIIMLSTAEDDESLFEAVKSGASGYLLKSLHAEELFDLLAGLERGEAVFSPGLAGRIIQEFVRILTTVKTNGENELSLVNDNTYQEHTSSGCDNTDRSNEIEPENHQHQENTENATFLNSRQSEVLRLVAEGKTYKEVAAALDISERTVKYHMGRILDILHVNSKAQASSYAVGRNTTNL